MAVKKNQRPFWLSMAAFGLLAGLTQPGQPGIPAERGQAENKAVYQRRFAWNGADGKAKQVEWLLAKADVRKEQQEFGVPRDSENPLIMEKKGFTRIGIDLFIVNYKEIFQRNRDYFRSLTPTLHSAIGGILDPLSEFLAFVQNVKFKKPPTYYGNKFINSFFPPLICLYEQYGDCDSKAVLLADFLVVHDPKERMGLLLIKGGGLNHALLMVKRNPLPGQSALFVINRGYYLPLETTSPGWSPGFIAQPINEAIRAGNFFFHWLD